MKTMTLYVPLSNGFAHGTACTNQRIAEEIAKAAICGVAPTSFGTIAIEFALPEGVEPPAMEKAHAS